MLTAPRPKQLLVSFSAILFFASLANFGFGQELTCLTATPNPDPLLSLSYGPPYNDRAAASLANVYVHVIRRTDGTGGLTAAQVDDLIEQADEDLGAVFVHLKVVGTENLDNTTWYNDPIASASTLFATNAHTNAIDIYLGPNSGDARGKAAAIPSVALVLTGTAEGTRALSHVLGHCLGLHDADETTYGAENPDGSNKSAAGDLIGDTAADPGLSGYVDANCELTTSFTSLYPNHDPDLTNIMTSGRMACWSGFSAEQGARMLAALEHITALRDLRDIPVVEYVDRSSATGITYSGQPRNGVTVDYNENGRKDLLITRAYGSGSALGYTGTGYTGEGVPTFNSANPFGSAAPAAATSGLIAADYDNDGHVDLFAASYPAKLYRGDGTAFADVSTASGIGSIYAAGGSWGDYDNDGRVDLFYVAEDDPFGGWGYLLHNNANGTFTSAGAEIEVTSTNSPLWADFDDDGDLDLMAVGAAAEPVGPPGDWSQTRYWVNDGDGTFTEATDRIDGGVVGYTVAAVADMDNDGDFDVPYSSRFGIGWMENIGNNYFATRVLADSFTMEQHDFAVADVDLDGFQDILVSAENTLSLLANRTGIGGQRILVDETSVAGLTGTGSFQGITVADYDYDGRTDLYVGRAQTAPFYYKARARAGYTQNHWLGVRVSSPYGANNTLGLGAAITIATVGGLTQCQIVDGGSGKASQHEHDLVFGLGSYSGAVQVEVKWPNGRIQNFTASSVDQYIDIVDDTAVMMDSTVAFSIEFDAGDCTQDWVFTWKTHNASTLADDTVTFDLDNVPTRCRPYFSQLTDNTFGVDVTQSPSTGDTYEHVLTWYNVPCVARCSVPYTVRSAQGPLTTQSASHTISIPTCIYCE